MRLFTICHLHLIFRDYKFYIYVKILIHKVQRGKSLSRQFVENA